MAAKNPGYSKQLVLAIILFVFASLAYWLVYSKQPKDAAKEADAKKVFAISDAQIKRIEIEGAQRDDQGAIAKPSYQLDVALECQSLAEKLCKPKDASKWMLVEPLRVSSDDSTVNALMKNFGNLTTSEIVDLSTDTPEKRETLLKEYGLGPENIADPKTRKVRLVLADGRTLTAYFGAKHPISGGSFTLLATAPEGPTASDKTKVFVVPDWQLSVFTKKTSHFRDKTVLGGNERDVIAFTLSKSKKNASKVEGKKDPKSGKWTIKTRGEETAGDLGAIEGVLSGVMRLMAKDIAAEKKNDSAGRKALAGASLAVDLSMVLKDSTKRVRLYEKKSSKGQASVYASVDGIDPLFEIETSQLDRIDRKFEDLRMRKLLASMDRFAVTGIRFTGKGKKPWKATVNKVGHSWTTPEGMSIDEKRIDPILEGLTSSIVISFTGSAPGSESLVIAFGTTDQPLEKGSAYEVEFWKKGDRLFARDLLSKGRGVVELKGDFASKLPWNEGFLAGE